MRIHVFSVDLYSSYFRHRLNHSIKRLTWTASLLVGLSDALFCAEHDEEKTTKARATPTASMINGNFTIAWIKYFPNASDMLLVCKCITQAREMCLRKRNSIFLLFDRNEYSQSTVFALAQLSLIVQVLVVRNFTCTSILRYYLIVPGSTLRYRRQTCVVWVRRQNIIKCGW